eukprot:g2190.t1
MLGNGTGCSRVETVTDSPEQWDWLTRLPNTSFGIALGLAGTSLLWRTIAVTPLTRSTAGHAAVRANQVFWWCALATFVLLSALYCIKAHFWWTLVRAEWQHPVRVHFFNCPHLVVLVLCLGCPAELIAAGDAPRRTAWLVCCASQLLMTQRIYARWVIDPEGNIGKARPPFLLSTVGWPMLTLLGQALEIDTAWGLDLTAFCFGAGTFFYILVVLNIFVATHGRGVPKARSPRQCDRRSAGDRTRAQEYSVPPSESPAFFLLLAPASLLANALRGMGVEHDVGGGAQAGAALVPLNFGPAPCAIFGYVIVVMCILLQLGPQLAAKPETLGIYWAYVFPFAALATLGVHYCGARNSRGSEVLAWTLVALSQCALAAVFCRMSWHHHGVVCGNELWEDPVRSAWRKGHDRPRSRQLRSEQQQLQAVVGSRAGVCSAAVATS